MLQGGGFVLDLHPGVAQGDARIAYNLLRAEKSDGSPLPFIPADRLSAVQLPPAERFVDKLSACWRASGSISPSFWLARYLRESRQAELAIAYLSAMERGEKNRAFKQTFHAAEGFARRRIELARERYREATGKAPLSGGAAARREGYLDPPPVDYGGGISIWSRTAGSPPPVSSPLPV